MLHIDPIWLLFTIIPAAILLGFLLAHMLTRSKLDSFQDALDCANKEYDKLFEQHHNLDRYNQSIENDKLRLVSKNDDLITENHRMTAYVEELHCQIKDLHAVNQNQFETYQRIIRQNEDLLTEKAGLESQLQQFDHIGSSASMPHYYQPERNADREEERFGLRIPQASTSDRDDLQRINGLEEFVERKLNKLGIYTFEQISKFDEELIETISNAIDFFPDQILQDDWVGQAFNLYQIKLSNPSEFRKKGEPREAKNKIDDLKVVIGIDEKIENLLHCNGIHNCLQLAQTKVERLQQLIAEAEEPLDPPYIPTWPKQATLAAAGKWVHLKKLQEILQKGKS